jgi:hypothetical protein
LASVAPIVSWFDIDYQQLFIVRLARVATSSLLLHQRANIMKKLIVAATALCLVCLAGSAQARLLHGDREGLFEGAHFGSINGNTYTHHGAAVGPFGGLSTNSGTITHTGQGQWSNSGTAYGPRGRAYAHSGTTSCSGGTCSHSGSVTGPDGHTYSSNDSVTRNGPGEYSSTGSVSGPNGTYSRHASTGCVGDVCARTTNVTGPNGETYSHTGVAVGGGAGAIIVPPVVAPALAVVVAPAPAVAVVPPAPPMEYIEKS